ncbi:MAG: hypothetical protein ACRBBO_15480 [Cognatishimia sp.]
MSLPDIDRSDLYIRNLVWILARDRVSAELRPRGFWDGDDDVAFQIDDEERFFSGSGSVLSVPNLKSRSGVVVQTQKLTLSALAPEVRDLVHGLDIRLAKVFLYWAEFDPVNGTLKGIHRVFKGSIDAAPERIGAVGQGASVELSLVSSARLLTRKAHILKSHASQSKRSGDGFFRHADLSGKTKIYWGSERS